MTAKQDKSLTRRITRMALLTAIALTIFLAEAQIPNPIPIPGVKLGLANIVTLIALYLFGPGTAFAILIPRCMMGAIFGGGITGLLFSLTGGLLAMSVMSLSRKWSMLSIYGVSVLGAAAHSVGQILAAMVLMNSVYVGAYLPWLLGVSVFTGLATGAAGAGVLRVLRGRV